MLLDSFIGESKEGVGGWLPQEVHHTHTQSKHVVGECDCGVWGTGRGGECVRLSMLQCKRKKNRSHDASLFALQLLASFHLLTQPVRIGWRSTHTHTFTHIHRQTKQSNEETLNSVLYTRCLVHLTPCVCVSDVLKREGEQIPHLIPVGLSFIYFRCIHL